MGDVKTELKLESQLIKNYRFAEHLVDYLSEQISANNVVAEGYKVKFNGHEVSVYDLEIILKDFEINFNRFYSVPVNYENPGYSKEYSLASLSVDPSEAVGNGKTIDLGSGHAGGMLEIQFDAKFNHDGYKLVVSWNGIRSLEQEISTKVDYKKQGNLLIGKYMQFLIDSANGHVGDDTKYIIKRFIDELDPYDSDFKLRSYLKVGSDGFLALK